MFEGRCDAVLLSSDLDYAPPDDAPASWRGKLAIKPNSVNEVAVNVGKLSVDVAAP